VLFGSLYDALGANMTFRLDNGEYRRIYMRDLPALADETMGALFECLETYSVNRQALKDYAMQSGSISAVRVLLQRYHAQLPAEERELLARIVRENYPPERYADWLEDALRPQITEENNE